MRKFITALIATSMLAAPALAQRDPAYDAARSAGQVGEKMDGYLGIVGASTAALQRDSQHQRTQGVEQRRHGLNAGNRGAQHGRAALRLGGQRLHALLEFTAQQGQQGLALFGADVGAARHAPGHGIHRHAGGVDGVCGSPTCGGCIRR